MTLTFNGCEQWDGGEVDVLVMGAPMDLASTSTSGQRKAPFYIREAGTWDNGYSLQHDVDWMDLYWADMGDVEMVTGDMAASHLAIEKAARKALKKAGTLVTLGGDHSVSLAVLRAYRKPPVVIHFDAHHDYDEGTDHGTWVRNGIDEGVVDEVLQYGCRGWGYAKETHGFALTHGVTALDGLPDPSVLEEFVRGRPVHLSVDIDVCDPCYAPGVAYQEPGGWTSGQLLEAVFSVARNCDVRGLDVVEVIPAMDPTGITSRLANRVVAQLATGLACQQALERAGSNS